MVIGLNKKISPILIFRHFRRHDYLLCRDCYLKLNSISSARFQKDKFKDKNSFLLYFIIVSLENYIRNLNNNIHYCLNNFTIINLFNFLIIIKNKNVQIKETTIREKKRVKEKKANLHFLSTCDSFLPFLSFCQKNELSSYI